MEMKTKYKSRLISFATAAFFTMTLSTIGTVNKVYAASTGQEILITEVMPMSRTSDDSYEYIELYNNSDKNIDLKDYKLPLQNIDFTTSKIISPKGVLVLCTKSSTTLENFNTFYGTSLTAEKYVVLPFVDEVLSNSLATSIILAKDDGIVVSRAQYSTVDFQVKKSITYKYSETEFDMIMVGQSQNPTPGSITAGQAPQNGVRVTGIALSKSYLAMDVSQTSALYATVAPATATNKSVIWTSDNANVVEVNQQGVLTSKSVGVANITATTVDGGFAATCTVVVARVPVTGMTLNKNSAAVDVGKAIILTASIVPENATNKSVTWTSSNSNIASVDSNGIVIGNAAGQVKITAATVDGNYTAVCTVTVNSVNSVVRVTGIALNKTNVTLKTGNVIILEPQISPSNATNKQVTWKSSNSDVAYVDNLQGIVVAKQPGAARITATTVDGGRIANCYVTVTNAIDSYVPVTSIELNTNVILMNKGENESLTAETLPANATNKSVTWSTDDSSVVTVDSYGKISALKEGIAVVTAKAADGSLKDRCFIIVRADEEADSKIFSMRLNKTFIRVKEGKFEKLTPIINPGYMKKTNLDWKSSNEAIATVSDDGRVRGIREGEVEITVTTKDGKYSAKCTVQVTDGKGFGNGNGNGNGRGK
jgi:uncharacterized protein YjdB